MRPDQLIGGAAEIIPAVLNSDGVVTDLGRSIRLASQAQRFALQAMHEIVRERFNPSDWNIYAAQASDGDNSYSDGELAGLLLTEKILPVCQFFAYLEVGESGGSAFDLSDSSLWTLYERLRNGGAPLSMRKVSERSEIFPVFHDLFQRREAQEKAAP